MKFCCIGDNCVDYYVDTDEVSLGGNIINVSVYLRRLNKQASYVGALGNDRFGKMFIDTLNNKQIDTSHIEIIEGNTPKTDVFIKNNNRVFGDYDEGIYTNFNYTSKQIQFVNSHDYVLTGYFSKTAAILDKITIPIAFDFADYGKKEIFKQAIPYVEYAFFSNDKDELDLIKEDMIDTYKYGPKVVIVTRGSKGSIAYDGNEFYEYGIIPCEVVDTLGAGDSYISGFMGAISENKSILEAMEAGAKNSAITISYRFAW